MHYLALATDYDGTLATHGRVTEETLAALERLRASGRKLIMVTGRELPDLFSVFPEIDLFDWVVAENGALLYRPGSKEEKPLAEAPPEKFVQLLRARGVGPISVGRVIVATWEPHETVVLETIRDLGLELQVIFNKGAVMVLPAGITKATGLAATLKDLRMSAHNVVGVGDAENDHAFLGLCECGVAVANALPMVKEKADWVTRGDHGAGVTALIDQLVKDDLASLEGRLVRHHVLLGKDHNGQEKRISPRGVDLLVAGPSGSGKTTLMTGLLERLAGQKYQFCLIDPEGDYGDFEAAVVLGNSQRAPSVQEIVQLLESPKQNVVVNLVGLRLGDRPPFFLSLLPRLLELRARTGRPHWLVLDETHHLLPVLWAPASLAFPEGTDGIVRITVRPSMIAPAALASAKTIIALGDKPEKTLQEFCVHLGCKPPALEPVELLPGEFLAWDRHSNAPADRLQIVPGRGVHRRHSRKYAEGELPPERSFYFRGEEGKLNLRAQNLILFMQLADGVDDATWMYHLRRGEYSRWFREGIKDEALAAEAATMERQKDVSPAESRAFIKKVIEQTYTLPASPPLPIAGTPSAPRPG
jgi:HAD superfamily hydrolase (TIGR01484 family)